MEHTYTWGSWSGKYMTILSMSSSYFLMKEMMEAMEVKAATILLPRFKKIQRHAIAHTNLAMDTIMVAGTQKMTK